MCSQLPKQPAILFLIPGDIDRQTGGSIYNQRLALALIESGFRLEIVTLPDLPYFAGLLASLVISPLLLFRLAGRKYDVVIHDGWTHPTTFLFDVVCRVTGKVRLVIIAHQIRSQAIRPPLRFIARTIERLALGSAQLIIAVSAFIRGEVERLVGGNAQNIAVACPGSDALAGTRRVRRDCSGQPLCLLFVGSCTPLKGLDHLIAALSLLQDVELRLDVVGDVSLEPRFHRALVRKAKMLGVVERITFHGLVSRQNLGPLYSRADIFTFPSLYEGFGIVLGEAMNAGLPIVATRTGPIDEIVREDENALIVPPADSVAFAAAIRKLADDPSMRRDFGLRSLELARSLVTWKQTCDSICQQVATMIRTSPGTKQKTKTIPTP